MVKAYGDENVEKEYNKSSKTSCTSYIDQISLDVFPLPQVQPLLFDSEFAPTLKSCLDAILEVFEAHLISEDRQLTQLAMKTVAFCHRLVFQGAL